MAGPIVSSPRTIQPTAGVQAPGRPFASKLRLLINGRDGFLARNAVDGSRAVVYYGLDQGTSAARGGIGFNANSNGLPGFLARQFVTGPTFTLIVVANPAQTSAVRPLYVQRNSGGGTNCSLIANFHPDFTTVVSGRLGYGIDGANGFYADNAITGRIEAYGLAAAGVSGRMYCSGAALTTTVLGTPGSPFSSTQDTYFGHHAGTSTWLEGQILGIAMWDGVALPDELMRRITANFWQLFAPAPPRMWAVDAQTLPTITAHPVEQTGAVGSTATFSLTATGATSYQWQDNPAGTWTDISGATSASYTTGTLTSADNGRLFRCKATSTGGTACSAEVYLFLSGLSSFAKGRPSAWLTGHSR